MARSSILRLSRCLARPAALSAAVAFAYPSISAECSTSAYEPGSAAALRSFAGATKTNFKIFSVGAVGNENIVFSQDLTPIPVQDLAREIGADPKFGASRLVLLEWSFSSRGAASYATQLKAILGKPVFGFSGPIWIYSDGAVISARTSSGAFENLTEKSVSECADHNGEYHTGRTCEELFAKHKGLRHVFSNVGFSLSCRQIKSLQALSDRGDRNASFRLLNYYSFVDRNDALEGKYRLRASTTRRRGA